ncbi:terpene synthase family protein [Kitasatospora sp. NPDC004531]
MPNVPFAIPFPSRTNQHLPQVRPQHIDWLHAMGLLAPGIATDAYLKQKLPELIAMCYPQPDAPGLQHITDSWAVMMALDDLFERQAHSAQATTELANRYIAVISGPSAPVAPGGDPLARAWQDVWRRQCRDMSPRWQERARRHWIDYIAVCAEETQTSRSGQVPGLDDYFSTRRRSLATPIWFDLVEASNRTELPDLARENDLIRHMVALCCDAVACINDTFSLEKEEANGELNNLITVLQHHRGFSRAQAIAHAQETAGTLADQLQESSLRFPALYDLTTLGEADKEALLLYVDSMHSFVRGNYDWHFVTSRYSG